MNKFNGFNYPITKDPKGYWRNTSDVNQIKSDLLILLLTNPGERVMLPSFGTNLRSLFFEPNDAIITATANNLITQAISTWEPRIAVTNISVSTTIDPSALNVQDNMTQINHILYIKINFVDPQNINSIEQLTLLVPLGGS